MDTPLIALLVGVVVALVIAGAYYAWKQEKKRREELAAFAHGMGWAFSASRDTRHDDQYAHFEIFRQGHSRSAFNTMSGDLQVGDWTCRAKAGDFEYKVTSSNGKSTTTTTHRFSYLILHLPFRQIPDLLIRREGMFDKLAGAFGFEDIDFESAEFSKRFFVKSSDKRFAYDVIDAQMMEWLLSGTPPTIDIERGRCCIAESSRRWQASQFAARIRFLQEFFQRWPAHVRVGLEASHG